jgi:hypothetical protein
MSEGKYGMASAATDVTEFIGDLSAGTIERALSVALSQTAASAIDTDKKGKVQLTFDLERIAGTQQVRIGHSLQFVRPTMTGRVTELTEGADVMHVGKYGALSLAQPSLLDKRQATLDV